MTNFEIVYENNIELSFEEFQDIICQKIAKIINHSTKELNII